ncbi:MAG: GGDEF domain-containing protein [Sumerlaeia bacterium]
MSETAATDLPRVLIVEPEEALRAALAELLNDRCRIDAVANPTVAQREYSPDAYHAIFIGLSEEREGAFELARYCAALAQPPSIIGITGLTGGASVAYAYEAGLHGVLQTSFDREEVLAMLDSALLRHDSPAAPSPVRYLFDIARRLRITSSMTGLRPALHHDIAELLDANLATLVLPLWEEPVLMAQKGATISPGYTTHLAMHLQGLWKSYAGPETAWDWHRGFDDIAAGSEQTTGRPPTLVSAPINLFGEISGFLTISPAPGVAIDQDRLDVLFALAEVLSARLECIVYASEAESVEFRYDSLTGVLNHGTIMTRLKDQLHRARRTGMTVSLIVVDLDDLTGINDRCGHPAGDAALKHTGRLIMAQARKSDLVGRLAGEEFLIILPNTAEEGAARYAERIRRSVTANLIRSGEHEISVTVSIGVITVQKEHADSDAEVLVNQAHAAATKAFEMGGNQLMAAELPSSSQSE